MLLGSGVGEEASGRCFCGHRGGVRRGPMGQGLLSRLVLVGPHPITLGMSFLRGRLKTVRAKSMCSGHFCLSQSLRHLRLSLRQEVVWVSVLEGCWARLHARPHCLYFCSSAVMLIFEIDFIVKIKGILKNVLLWRH